MIFGLSKFKCSTPRKYPTHFTFHVEKNYFLDRREAALLSITTKDVLITCINGYNIGPFTEQLKHCDLKADLLMKLVQNYRNQQTITLEVYGLDILRYLCCR